MDTAINYDYDSFTHSENLETFGLIWLDVNPNNMEKNRNTEQQMRDIINHFRKFEDLDRCEEYIEQTSKEDRLVLIVSDGLGRELVPRIHRLQQVSSIYVYGMNNTVNGRWTSQFAKIKVSTVQLDELLVQIKLDQRLRARVQEPFSAHIFSTGCVSDKSTTEINGHTNREVADIYLYRGDSIDNLEVVLFEIDATPHVGSTKPFANISPYSNFPDESEVLFTLGSIFRLISISAGDDKLWVIRMELCTDDEHNLTNNNITPEGLPILANALHHNRKLEKLDLSYNTISDIGVSFIAHSINNSTVTILVLNRNCITDEGARYLAEMLKTSRILVYLGLHSNLIGEQGVKYLADALTTCNTTLKELSLRSNKFLRDSSIDSLFAILKYNNALDTLDVSDCNISTVGIARLQDKANQKSSFHFVTSTKETCHDSHPASSWFKVFLSRIK
ncbi:unnamed protein product [Rotaria magnacalcarata]